MRHIVLALLGVAFVAFMVAAHMPSWVELMYPCGLVP